MIWFTLPKLFVICHCIHFLRHCVNWITYIQTICFLRVITLMSICL